MRVNVDLNPAIGLIRDSDGFFVLFVMCKDVSTKVHVLQRELRLYLCFLCNVYFFDKPPVFLLFSNVHSAESVVSQSCDLTLLIFFFKLYLSILLGCIRSYVDVNLSEVIL